MIILGIDPGLRTTGYGVIQVVNHKPVCLAYGGIVNKGKDTPFAEKLLKIHNGIVEVVEQYKPDHCAIEDIFYHENVNTAIVMGHARGVAMLAAQQQNVQIFEYSAREVKLSTVGVGAAAKQQVQAMVKNVLRLKKLPTPQDAADALAVAICHFNRIKFLSLKAGIK